MKRSKITIFPRRWKVSFLSQGSVKKNKGIYRGEELLPLGDKGSYDFDHVLCYDPDPQERLLHLALIW